MALFHDPATNANTIEMMAPVFEESYLLPQAAHIDGAVGFVANETGAAGGGSGPGKFYFEVTVTQVSNADETSVLFGIANSTFNITKPQSLDLAAGLHSPQLDGGVFWKFNNTGGTAWYGGSSGPNSFAGLDYETRKIGIAVDTTAHYVWARDTSAPTTWYGVGGVTPDPTTGVAGFDYTGCGISTGQSIYILVGCSQWGDNSHANYAQLVLNTGASAFNAAAPTGFAPYDSSGSTTINPSDKGADLTLSGGNLSMTSGIISGSNQPCEFARSTTAKLSA
jgi:hypothetical protein